MKRFEKKIIPCENHDGFIKDLKTFLGTRNRAAHTYFEEVESQIDERMELLKDQVKTYDDLIDKYNHLIEYKQVLELTKWYVGEGGAR